MLEIGNFAVDAQDVISATTPIIAKFLIVLIFLNFNCLSYSYGFSDTPRFFRVVAGIHFLSISCGIQIKDCHIELFLRVSVRICYVVFLPLAITVSAYTSAQTL